MAAPASINATGKRKTAIARIYMRPGSGRILVNQRNFEEYFPMETTRNLVRKPLELVSVGVRFRYRGQRPGRRHRRAGRGGETRPEPGPGALQPRAARRPEKGRLPHPGRPHQRAEEIRPPGRPPRLPVLEALNSIQWPVVSARKTGIDNCWPGPGSCCSGLQNHLEFF